MRKAAVALLAAVAFAGFGKAAAAPAMAGDAALDAAFTKALNALVADGHTRILTLSGDPTMVRATVVQNGKTVILDVDPRAGIILPSSDPPATETAERR